jgi:hypothetical protein
MTVNPRLIEGARFQTVRSMVTALHSIAELVVVPIDRIDFRRGRVLGYRRTRGGRFEPRGTMTPRCDVWLNYTDGFYLDHAKLGFVTRGAFLGAQHDLYREGLASGRVGRVINAVDAEQATLKLWLSRLDPNRDRVLESHRLAAGSKRAMSSHIERLRARLGPIVIKPNWGGASLGVGLVASREQTREFVERHWQGSSTRHPFDDWCVQPLAQGAEKRLWFVGDRCVDGRILVGRPPPWDHLAPRSRRIERYYFGDPPGRAHQAAALGVSAHHAAQFRADLEIARAVWRKAGLEVGSVDFIGDRVNELNGCGTTFTQYDGWNCVTDARPALVRWLRGELGNVAVQSTLSSDEK